MALTGDYADDLMMIQDKNYTDPDEAQMDAQEFANEHQMKMYVLVDDERGGYWVNDQKEGKVHDEALPDPK